MFNKLHKILQAAIVLALVFVSGWGAVSPAYAAGKIIRVKADATGNNSGGSWSNAYTDLQSALAVAVSGDQIWVAAGTYKPTATANRAISFNLKNGVSIYGGFVGTETKLADRSLGPNATILSGDIGTIGDPSDNSHHVVVGSYVNTSAVLSGFTITAGNANGGSYPFSGGGMVNRFGSSPTLSSLIFSNNVAYNDGGGLANLDDGSPQLTNVRFIQNTAVGGGGMYSTQGGPALTNVIFDSNEANTGGGLLTSSDSASLKNVTFFNNQADRDGGGIADFHGSLKLTNVTFVENTADRSGGAMFMDYYSQSALTNVTISDNTAGIRGGGLSITNKSNAKLINTILWNNTAPQNAEVHVGDSKPTSYKSIIRSGCPSGMTCSSLIISNPDLGPYDNYGGSMKTIAILDGSSAIDTGDDTNCPNTDQRGVKRPQGSHCDIGAFESADPGVPVLVSPPNDVQAISLRPRLIWKPSNADVIEYRLQVSKNSTFSTTVIDEDHLSSTSFVPVSELNPGTKYFWRVNATNYDGDTSGWSRVWSFTTPLEAAVLVSPTDGQIFLTDRIAFDWEPVTLAERYELQVSTTATFSTLVLKVATTATKHTMGADLPPNKTLYWRVRGNTSVVTGIWSEKWSFQTGNPPSVPVLVSPAKDALTRDYTPRFNWEDSKLPAGAAFKQYELQVDNDNDFSSPVIDTATDLNDITNSEFTPLVDLPSNTRYHWRVRSVSTFNAEDHVSAWSSVWSFRAAIAPPTSLIVVPNDVNPLRPSFDWDDAAGPGITGYVIQVSTRADFSILLVNSTTMDSMYAMRKDLPTGKTIHWRVRVMGARGPSAWSTTDFVTP